MKKQILEELKKNPKGTRVRNLVSTLHYSRLKIITALHELSNENLVRSSLVRDMANMEMYDLWFAA